MIWRLLCSLGGGGGIFFDSSGKLCVLSRDRKREENTRFARFCAVSHICNNFFNSLSLVFSMMMYVSVYKLNERKNNAKQIAVLKQEIDGLGATNQAKQLAKQAAEKNAMVSKLISTVRHKALQSKNERLNSTKEKLTKAEDILEEKEEQIASLKSEVQDMAQEIETLVKEMEKLNKLRVDEIQKTYDSYIGYLNTEKKSREQEVKEAQVALDKEMQALEQTTRKLEQTVADKSKHQALDNGEDVSDSEDGGFEAPEEEEEELDE